MKKVKTFQLNHDNAPAHFAHVIQDLSKKWHAFRSTAYVLSGFGTMRFLAFSKIENDSEREVASVTKGHHKKNHQKS